MADELRFDGKVAIVTGAGGGLGRTHALLLGSRGAKVVVNDLGGGMHGDGAKSSAAADKVVEEIKAAGGQAVATYDSVEDGAKIVQTALDAFKRIDIVINNAGILRDVTFHKMSQSDWDLIYKVHVLGGFRVAHAAWPHLRDQGYGRVIFTASAAGIYGNFGQANYSMAKLGLVGLANSLAIEGAKKNVLVNTIAPIAGSRMTETVLPKELIDALKPEYVSPLVAWLCHESCTENGGLFEVGGGYFAKLRWERTEGKMFRLGRVIAPEAIRSAWSQITDFGKATHPSNVNESLGPVMSNATAAPSRGGNEFIDVDTALEAAPTEVSSTYTERDLSLYALGVGAAADPTDRSELAYVYELNPEGFVALPTYGVVPAINAVLKLAMEGKQPPGLNYGLDRILHGEQYTEVKRPLPTHATLKHKVRVKDIFDKGKHAVVVSEIRSSDAETNEELIYNELSMVVRGAGGWGGERGTTTDIVPPERAPDAVSEEKISPNQAILYRLSGDWNPLHVDPDFAQGFGFEKPVLHGLCTFGYVGRAVIKHFAKNDARFFKSIRVRFADTVYPGETLRTEMWKDGGRIIVRALVKERNKVVISNAAVELYAEIPKPAAKAPTKAEAVAPAAPAPGPTTSGGTLTAADVFGVIGAYVKEHPELTQKVNMVYQWKISSPDSTWVLDLKQGTVAPGEAKADCTLALSNDDFIAMCTGKAEANKLYFGKQLKITGNVIASQKLEFLKQMDTSKLKAGASSGAVPSAAPASAATGGSTASADIFGLINGYLAIHPELAKKIGMVYQFKLSSPDSSWVLDLKNGDGSVSAGEAKADCTLALTDADFVAMCTGKADANKLYFGKQLKITGNVIASQKLDFLKQLDRNTVKPKPVAMPAAPSGTSTAQTKAPAIFKALAERLTKTPALAKEVGAVLQFNIKEPEASWTVDLSSTNPTVTSGTSDKAKTTFTLTDEALGALAKGERTPYDLYMHAEMRVDGDIGPAHRLTFFKQLL